MRQGDCYLTAEPSGEISCDRTEAREWETFLPVATGELMRLAALIAAGWNLEPDFRLKFGEFEIGLEEFLDADALEAGAIPIVERRGDVDYFAEAFGSRPFPAVADWCNATGIVEELRGAGDIDDRIARCFAWWQQYKAELRQRIAATTADFSPADPRARSDR